MRILYVVQRFGPEIPGGAERFCWEFASRLAARGEQVDVLTSCATSYVDWANVYEPGTSDVEGVTVHRLPVVAARDQVAFGAIHQRLMTGHRPTPLYVQEAWMTKQGPLVRDLAPWIAERAEGYDLIAFFTYLYYTTWAGLPAAAGRTATVLHPAAHDETPLYLPIFDVTVRMADGFGFLTPEEQSLVERRFHVRRPSVITGIGVDLDAAGDPDRFRARFALGDDPYLLYVGRLDPHKGSDELYGHFTAYKARNPGPLKLVAVGDPVRPLADHPDVVVTGVVDQQTKWDAIEGATIAVNPSFFESFSMFLSEAWARSKPVLVQGHSDVLTGQARRAGGAIPYTGFAEFEAALDLLLDDPALASRLGAAGHSYVDRHYRWDNVLDHYQGFLGHMAERRRGPTTQLRRRLDQRAMLAPAAATPSD